MTDVNPTVLLVEDDRFLRRAAEASLRQAGFTVALAGDGEEALRQVAAVKPAIVLLDLIMPKLQGFEVLRRLKAAPATASIPVVVTSNLGQETDVKQAMNLGAAAYFIKSNLSLQELVAVVRDTLKKSGT
jgi:DNA-binding response OmpR family regulator